jgi:hypothetical protein
MSANIMEVEQKEWYHYSHETVPKIPPTTTIDALGQCDKNYIQIFLSC